MSTEVALMRRSDQFESTRETVTACAMEPTEALKPWLIASVFIYATCDTVSEGLWREAKGALTSVPSTSRLLIARTTGQ